MLVQNRRTSKYIRVVIPTDLRDRLGAGEVVRSLRTTSHREAVSRGPIVEYAIRLSFDEARRDPTMTRAKLKELVDRLGKLCTARGAGKDL